MGIKTADWGTGNGEWGMGNGAWGMWHCSCSSYNVDAACCVQFVILNTANVAVDVIVVIVLPVICIIKTCQIDA